MKLLLDEDAQSHRLVQLLRAANHDVETVNEAGIAGSSDLDVLVYAKQTSRILMTRNAKDFLELHQQNKDHPGIVVEYLDAHPAKNMKYDEIVAAIGKISDCIPDMHGQFIGLNAWQ